MNQSNAQKITTRKSSAITLTVSNFREDPLFSKIERIVANLLVQGKI